MTMITPSYLGETIEYSSLHACRSTLEDPTVSEKPYTKDRGVCMYIMNRQYWESRFYDEAFWKRYFDMLAADRFNKFRLVFGYENAGFLVPVYPYFFNTPGFPDVHMTDLTPEQQQKNTAMLNRVIELAHERGIAFAVGIWDHIYRGGVQAGAIEWENEYRGRPLPNNVVGVTTENLNAYTLASLKEFFKTFPAIDEAQFRIHEESGLKREEMDGFWHAVFQLVRQVKPDLLIEARGKGVPDNIIDDALSMGVHLRMETKYWMEQLGLPFHPTHVNPEDQRGRRHGYADFLHEPKKYDMNWSLWNGGTTRVLLWADPDYVRRFAESTHLYDSPNWDINEPLATKMEAQRPTVKPFDLMPAKYRYFDYEFERYWHFFQVWGRVGYNPDTPTEVWDHEFARRFGAEAAPHLEAGLHRASQVLPYIVASSVYTYSLFPTTRGWAERQSLGATLAQYARNTGSDVQQFEGLEEEAKRLLAGGTTTRRTPEMVSRWFDDAADDILAQVAQAEKTIGAKRGNEFDSTLTDLRILANLARFHARRSLAAVHYNLYRLGGSVPDFDEAIVGEQKAIEAWRGIVDAAGDRYNFDLAMGARNVNLAGHWRDELATLERSFGQLQNQRKNLDVSKLSATNVVRMASAPAAAALPQVEGARVGSFKALAPLRVTAKVTASAGVQSVRLRYRHVSQFEDYKTLDMEATGEPNVYAATVPGDFLISKWDFMYFVEALGKDKVGTQWPDLAKEAPYVIVPVER